MNFNFVVFAALIVLFLDIRFLNSQDLFDTEYLFDDFHYTNFINPAPFYSSGSIFGNNLWITRDGIVSSRAWQGYVYHDSTMQHPSTTIKFDSVGVQLILNKGKWEPHPHPFIVSSFLFREGTYATRIKLEALKATDKIIQAYWLWSSTIFTFKDGDDTIRYWAEMDFEWNNGWYHDTHPRMKAGCNNFTGRNVLNTDLDCICYDNGKLTGFKQCVGEYKWRPLIGDRWMIYVMRVDKLGNKIAFEILSDEPELDYIVYSGESYKSDSWLKPYTIKNYYPQYEFQTWYSMHSLGESLQNGIKEEHKLEIDWFLYTANPRTSFSEIKSKVNELKGKNISRINTTFKPLSNNTTSFVNNNIAISGPDEVFTCEVGVWHVQPLYKGRNTYNLDYSYRAFINETPTEWFNVYNTEMKINISPLYDSLEIKLIATDEWEKPADTLIKKVNVIKLEDCFDESNLKLTQVFPNPVKDNLNIQYYNGNSLITIFEIYDFMGRKIFDEQDNNLVNIEHLRKISTSTFAQGIYYLKIIGGNQSLMHPIIILR
ncbi:MAG: hypothetical protein CVV22_01420 [Ignavibacteriae bacterium HGW-Ignavibacteriae-1]|jgi:hypothetical protein|nr:MAG: hypothetical protein CVV22_01420 [Ignavibacteriae bacterium HGW-Ignavibacteriae-1]